MVFCSMHGEFDRTLSILESLANHMVVSPADFTLSVHNALSGLLATALVNRGGHTTVSAGPDSFGCGVLEAVATLNEQPETPVLLVYFDEPLPPPFEVFDPDPPAAMALAVILTAASGERLTLTPRTITGPVVRSESAAHAFVHFMIEQQPYAESIGERLACRWARDYATA